MRIPLLCLAWVIGASATAQLNIPSGNYAGFVRFAQEAYFLRVDHQADSIKIGLPDVAPAQTLLGVLEGEVISFSTGTDAWGLLLGESFPQAISGVVQRNGEEGFFVIYLLEANQKVVEERYTQNYRLPTGEAISIWARSGRLQLHAPVSGRISSLLSINETKFISTAGEMITFNNLADGCYQSIDYQYFSSDVITAAFVPKPTIERKEVMILGDTVGLSLYVPAGEGPFPSCIIPMGAANYERWIYALEARLLAAHGIATLIYDNYGSGTSGGTLGDKTFADKRDQAVAMHAWLTEDARIHPDKIGFRGGSQGGRLSLMAAASVPNTGFVIALAAPLETRLDQQLFALSTHHRNADFPEEAIARNTELWRRFFRSVADQQLDEALAKDVQALREKQARMFFPNASAGQIPQLPWAADLTDDGRTYLPKINCPVMALYGLQDDRVPARRSATLLSSGLTQAGKQAPMIKLYPEANHSFQLPGQRIVPDLFMDQIRFIKEAIK